MARRKVYVVDDEEPIRRSACLLLTVAGFDATSFEGGTALLNVADSLVPGCILLDMRMPDRDGVDVQRALSGQASVHPVVIMTGHGDVQAAVSAFEGGAVAFVEKPFAKAHLLDALDLAFLKLEQPDGYAERLRLAAAAVAALGEEERALLARLARGGSTDEMAGELGIPAGELDRRRARIFGQLGVESVTGALSIAFAARLDLAPPDGHAAEARPLGKFT